MGAIMLLLMQGLLFSLCFGAIYFLLLTLFYRTPRWPRLKLNDGLKYRKLTANIAKLLRLHPQAPEVRHYKQLLYSSGLKLHAMTYLLIKRSLLIIGACLSAVFVMHFVIYAMVDSILSIAMVLLLAGLWGVALLDKSIFLMLSRRRRQRIIHEVYILSRQLLYYKGSKMNLHSKLKRCLPFTSALRQDLELLIRQWYDGAEQAIASFKLRLGTDEAYSFAETINALSLHDDARYYDLLQQRMKDYKEKLELDHESKKEAHSYVLFILAGLPIMNTFRVFIYPWVQEGQKLFESLN